jgi:aryl-alcohol dehydrogenase-like predicted oxidoreductase
MDYRVLGSSGLLVSPVCLGTMTFGTPVGEAEAVRLVHAAIDLGINFIDTANIYEGYSRFLGSPGGVAEEILGKALRGRRDQVVLVSKVGAPNGPGPQDRGLSATHILRELERSLRRLQTDTLDLYLLHWPDRMTPLETTVGTMEQAVRQGKIRYWGTSNHAAWQICEFLWLADRRSLPAPVASQIPLSLLRREFQHDLEFCKGHGIGVMAYQCLQGGMLAGKYRRGQAPPAGSRAADRPDWVWPRDDAAFGRVEKVEAMAQQAGIPMAQYAVAWTLAQPGMTAAVIGASNQRQVEEAVQAAGARLPPEHFGRLDEVCPQSWKPPDPVRG